MNDIKKKKKECGERGSLGRVIIRNIPVCKKSTLCVVFVKNINW